MTPKAPFYRPKKGVKTLTKRPTEPRIPPEPPEHLSPRSQGIWRDLVTRNVVSSGRLALFQSGLEALDRADEAREAIKRDGLLVGGKEGTLPHANPLLRVEKDARTLFARIWSDLNLGFEPDVDRR